MSVTVPFTNQKSAQSPTGEIAFLLFLLWLRHIIRSSRNTKLQLTSLVPGNNAGLFGEGVNGSGEHILCVNHRRRTLGKGVFGTREFLMTRLSWGRHGPQAMYVASCELESNIISNNHKGPLMGKAAYDNRQVRK